MPIYEYRCASCGHELEAIQRITADALTTCPECQDQALKRLISQTSFVLKGEGWYQTDYGSKKKEGTESSKEGAGSEASSSDVASASEGATSETGASDSGGSGEGEGGSTSSGSSKGEVSPPS